MVLVTNSGECCKVDSNAVFTRSHTTVSFDWKNNFFICGKKYIPNMKNSGHYSWSMVETVACQNNIYTKALQAAKERDDEEMTKWLHEVMNGDLGIVDAHYHQ